MPEFLKQVTLLYIVYTTVGLTGTCTHPTVSKTTRIGLAVAVASWPCLFIPTRAGRYEDCSGAVQGPRTLSPPKHSYSINLRRWLAQIHHTATQLISAPHVERNDEYGESKHQQRRRRDEGPSYPAGRAPGLPHHELQYGVPVLRISQPAGTRG